MTRVSWLAAIQDVVYGCLFPWGIATSERLDCGGNIAFRGWFVSGNAWSSLCGLIIAIRSPPDAFAYGWEQIECIKTPSIESCLKTLSTIREEGSSGRKPESGSSMLRQRGIIG